eukprot:TRINITY_DN54968_c0_g1_i1.p1 TRINITY_DN54968_c0_g1~~TRINITY_DN54968_c0_g1_i1.p1  ORF type:complete len:238 (+),score=32.99 TRINITY_DN54968_c0_g1_i1:31-714(+)
MLRVVCPRLGKETDKLTQLIWGEYVDYPRPAPNPSKVGRAWSAEEIRGKSADDLRKLWWVLVKENNRLETTIHWYNHLQREFPEERCLHDVRLSMKRLKSELASRHIYAAKIATKAFLERQKAGYYTWPPSAAPPPPVTITDEDMQRDWDERMKRRDDRASLRRAIIDKHTEWSRLPSTEPELLEDIRVRNDRALARKRMNKRRNAIIDMKRVPLYTVDLDAPKPST